MKSQHRVPCVNRIVAYGADHGPHQRGVYGVAGLSVVERRTPMTPTLAGPTSEADRFPYFAIFHGEWRARQPMSHIHIPTRALHHDTRRRRCRLRRLT
jgi:hypothetical protein